jgi:CBS domain-containing protein
VKSFTKEANMGQEKVRDLMVPLEDYATVEQEATLYQAIIALEETQKRFDQSRDKHRAVLVLDQKRQLIGKLDFLNVLRGLEPKYAEMDDLKEVRLNFTLDFIQSLIQKYSLWQQPLDDICQKATRIKVKDIMLTPSEGEFVSEEASLNEAIHQMVLGRHQSLLVTSGKAVIGILRLSDVFDKIAGLIKTCKL